MFEDGVHGVCDGEAVAPVVVRHASVVLPNRQRETNQVVAVEAVQTEEVLEHEDCVAGLFVVAQLEHAEVITVKGEGGKIINRNILVL